jgi:hypothetical protein
MKDFVSNRIWESMTPLGRAVMRRKNFDRVLLICVRQMPVASVASVRQDSERLKVVESGWVASASRSVKAEFGPLFWILLAPFVHFIITKILEYWYESRINRALISGWRSNVR